MSLEGLRAWIGEVERKLGKRTRVFLALAVIAIGLGGAAIYLAIDTRESSVSEGDVQALQEELEAQIDEAAATGAAATPPPPAEAAPAPEAEPAPDSEPKPDEKGTGGTSSSGATDGVSGGTGTGGAATGDTSKAKIDELLQRAKEQNAEAEAEQDEK